MKTRAAALVAAAALSTSCFNVDLTDADARNGFGSCTSVGANPSAARQSLTVVSEKAIVVGGGGKQLVAVNAAGGIEPLFATTWTTGSLELIAAAGTKAYFVERRASEYAIMSVPLAGGSATQLAIVSTSVLALAADSSYVYWAEGNAIRRVPVAGGAAALVTTPSNTTTWLASDGTNLYFLTYTDLYRIPVGGGAAVAMLASVPADAGVRFPGWRGALDATAVYLFDSAGVHRIPKSSTGATFPGVAFVPADVRGVTETRDITGVALDGGNLWFCVQCAEYSALGRFGLADGSQEYVATAAELSACDPSGAIGAASSFVYSWSPAGGSVCEVPK